MAPERILAVRGYNSEKKAKKAKILKLFLGEYWEMPKK